jgi:type 1 glutamine amidotransferase
MKIAFRLGLLAVWMATTWAAAREANIVIMIGEDQYDTATTLPRFAHDNLRAAGHNVVIIHADAGNPNHFPGLVAALKNADVLMVSVRRRSLPSEQLAAVRAHLDAGKSLVGIRTASHAFSLRPRDKLASPDLATWQDFDPAVLGGHYSGHHAAGVETTVTLAPGAAAHPIMKNVEAAKLAGDRSLYKVGQLEPGTTLLLLGRIAGQPAEAIAWTNVYGRHRARIFYTSMGDPTDFKNPEFCRLLSNAITWSVEK